MHAASQQFDQAPVCQSGDNIIYAWAMDAPALTLPDGVAFKVGGDTDIQWLVLQVHYKDVSSFQPPSQSSVLTHTHTHIALHSSINLSLLLVPSVNNVFSLSRAFL